MLHQCCASVRRSLCLRAVACIVPNVLAVVTYDVVMCHSVDAGGRSSLCEGHGTGLRATSGLTGGWVSGTCVLGGPVVHK